MASKKNGIVADTSLADILALMYAVDQTHEIMKSIKGAK